VFGGHFPKTLLPAGHVFEAVALAGIGALPPVASRFGIFLKAYTQKVVRKRSFTYSISPRWLIMRTGNRG